MSQNKQKNMEWVLQEESYIYIFCGFWPVTKLKIVANMHIFFFALLCVCVYLIYIYIYIYIYLYIYIYIFVCLCVCTD